MFSADLSQHKSNGSTEIIAGISSFLATLILL